jgi:hypothetical protein
MQQPYRQTTLERYETTPTPTLKIFSVQTMTQLGEHTAKCCAALAAQKGCTDNSRCTLARNSWCTLAGDRKNVLDPALQAAVRDQPNTKKHGS